MQRKEGETMKKQGLTDEIPRLTVYLPPEMERAVYADFLALARRAVEEATKGVMKNDRYINQKMLSEEFRCGVNVIAEWRAMGLKSFMKGKEIYFDRKDIDAFLDSIKK